MIINNKFNYQALERVDHVTGRRYKVGSGNPLPSVTTILSATKDKTFLDEWKANIGEDRAAKILSEASTLGGNMHSILEQYILGNPVKGQFMAVTLANLIIKKGLCKVNEVWGTEVGLYSEDLYAGTTDLVGVHEDVPAIMDFKNSLQEKKREWIEDYFMQLTAYASSHNEMYGTNIQKGVIMMATRTGKYLEFVIEGAEFVHYETMWANKVCAYYESIGRD